MDYDDLVSTVGRVHGCAQSTAARAWDQSLVWRNWFIGASIIEYEQQGADRAAYGARVIERLAEDLAQREFVRLSGRTLHLCRQVSAVYPQLAQMLQTGSASSSPVILQTLPAGFLPVVQQGLAQSDLFPSLIRAAAAQADRPAWQDAVFVQRLFTSVSWSHLVELVRLDPLIKRAFYEVQTLKEGWSVKELQRQLSTMLYERIGLSQTPSELMAWSRTGAIPTTPTAIIRDPYILEFSGLHSGGQWLETDLEQALITHLEQFLLELGRGFCFVARQHRMMIGGEDHHLDLLFYHRHLRCLVAIDLKLGRFNHADAGQMAMYLNVLRERETRPDEAPPIGIVLCADKDEEKVHFATNGIEPQVFVSRYQVELPTAGRLEAWLKEEQEVLARLATRRQAQG